MMYSNTRLQIIIQSHKTKTAWHWHKKKDTYTKRTQK
jgi:hypothetical protein